MRSKPQFVPYDDNNIDHVMAGPDYGQTGSLEYRWSEEDDYRDIEVYYSLLLKCRTLRKRP